MESVENVLRMTPTISRISMSQKSAQKKPSGYCPSCRTSCELIEICVKGETKYMPVACQSCMDKKKAEEEERDKKKKINAKERLLSLVDIGKAFEDCSFANVEHRQGLDLPLIWSKKFVETVSNKEKTTSIILTGTTGNGKTLLAACVNNALQDKNCNVLFTTLSMLFSKLGNYEKNEESSIYQILKTLDALILDDLGTESFNKKRLEWLFNIVDITDKFDIPVFITTNNFSRSMFEIANGNQEDDIRTQRIFSRLYRRNKFKIVKNLATDMWVPNEKQ